MLVQSLQTILEAAIAKPGPRNFSGNITDSEKLLNLNNLAQLETMHDGIFAFFAFHPQSDQIITDYLCQGSLSSDSGKHIFVLFTLDTPALKPVQIEQQNFADWLSVDNRVHPSYELISSLLPDQSDFKLPGILVLQRLSTIERPIFILLEDFKTIADLTALVRKIFAITTKSYVDTINEPEKFPMVMLTKLVLDKYTYYHGGPTSIKEWLIKAFYLVKKNLGDIVSVVKFFK